MSFFGLFSIALGAILVENYVLVQFLGAGLLFDTPKDTKAVLGVSVTVILVMTVASALTWVVNAFLLMPFNLSYLRTVAFVLIITSIAQALPLLHRPSGKYLPLVSTNCIVLGCALINTQYIYFPEALVSGLSAGLGFGLAMLLFCSMRERLIFSECPKSFEGVPITLVSAGLLALAFMGFSGLKV